MKRTVTLEKLLSKSRPVSQECISSLLEFRAMLDTLKLTKQTHYVDLDDFADPVYGFVHDALEKFGFVNGDPEANAKNPDASFWWAVYADIGCFDYSPFLGELNANDGVAAHHSSAYARCEVLKMELDNFISAVSWNLPESQKNKAKPSI